MLQRLSFAPPSSRLFSCHLLVKQGHIPSTLGRLVNLTQLDLAYNNLSGTIPSEVRAKSAAGCILGTQDLTRNKPEYE